MPRRRHGVSFNASRCNLRGQTDSNTGDMGECPSHGFLTTAARGSHRDWIGSGCSGRAIVPRFKTPIRLHSSRPGDLWSLLEAGLIESLNELFR